MAAANKGVNVFIGIAIITVSFLSGCSSHDKAVLKSDYDRDSKQIRKLVESQSQGNRSNAEIAPPADLTAAEYERLGDIYLGKGDPINTFTHYEKALQKDPQNIKIHYKKGLLFLIESMNNDAIASFEKVLEKEPDHALAHKGLGQSFFQLKQNEKAKEHLLKAVAQDSSLWSAHNLLGIIYDAEKNHPLAIAEYEKALAIKKDSGVVYNNIGLSYSMTGDYQNAIDSLNRAVKAGYTEDKVFNNLGFALFMAGRKREAFEAFKKGGNEAQAFNNLGSMYLVAGDHEKAQKCFEDAIVLKPAFYETANENLKKCSIRNLDDLTFSPESNNKDVLSSSSIKTEDIISRPVEKKHTQAYTIKEGDTAYSIAKQYNMELSDFLALNNLNHESPIYHDKTVLVRQRQ
jgi:Flp pilus assembly protein TadD